jgi:hypothetical protein
VVFATGYRVSYPFLDAGLVNVNEKGDHFGPLYLRTYLISEPTLSFPGLCDSIAINQQLMER